MSLTALGKEEIERIVRFEEPSPATILGPKVLGSSGEGALSIRAYLPRAVAAWVSLEGGERRAMKRVHDGGFYEVQLSGLVPQTKYRIGFRDSSGYEEEREDPYAFRDLLSDVDLYLINEGTHCRSYEKLGAHPTQINGIEGVRFSLWAPNARSVSVVGNFNHWKVGEHPMTVRGASGVWELFVPRLRASEVYKFAIKSNADGVVRLKIDPYAFKAELRPRTAAMVADLSSYKWGDGEWMASRDRKRALEKPVSVYELHLGSWRRRDGGYLSYREIADELVPYVEKLGFTHVELLPVMEHPLDDSWGYQVVNYYAPTSRFGGPAELMYLIDKCHQRGIGVILDWVPAHFPKDDYGLALLDGTHLFNHSDPRLGEHPDWGTLVFNFGRNEVRTFLISNAIFWLDKYHADGLRLDAVASMLYLDYSRKPREWVPNKYGGRENLEAIAFLRELNAAVHSACPGALMIAEESTAWSGVTRQADSGGLGFDLKWNMGWMHDTLEYFSKDAIYRKHHHNNVTFSLWYAFSERFILVLSHDEVVHGKSSMLSKMPGDQWQKFANLRLCYGYMYTHPGKKLLFMGNEFGQWGEWNFRRGLEWNLLGYPFHAQIQAYIGDLNRLYRSLPQLHELDFAPEGFEWIDFRDTEQGVISYIRKSATGDIAVAVFNMTPVPRHDYRIGVPSSAFYREVLNSDAREYGGSGLGNLGGLNSESEPWHGRPHSIRLTLPPLAVILFVPESEKK